MTEDLFILLCAVLKEVVPEAWGLPDEFVSRVARRMVQMEAVEWRIVGTDGEYQLAQLYAGGLNNEGKVILPLIGMEVFAKRKEGESWVRKVA